MTTLKIGDKAPDFNLPRDGGDTLSLKQALSSLKGQKGLVLFFYPKDSTPGCTKESIGFSEAKTQFEKAGIAIVGASKDSVKRHDNFVAKQNLTVPLVSDEEGSLCEDYGVWQEKKNYGRTYMGIVRSTFLIKADGTIAAIWDKVKVNGHVEEVLEAAKAL